MARTISLVALALVASAASVSAATWTDLGDSFCNAATGVDATASGTVRVPCNSQSAGVELLTSTNHGANWTSSAVSGAFMILDIAAHQDTIVLVSPLGQVYSTDGGKSFQKTTGASCQAQDAEYGGGAFHLTGSSFGSSLSGVATSTDGAAWTFTGIAELNTTARYGAFASADTWYVSAGSWPKSGDSDQSFRTEREAIAAGAPGNTSDVYSAQIVKTTDGGKTWSTVFPFTTNEFYFNHVKCAADDATAGTNCCAAAEAHGGPAPGGHIVCTHDGGKTWKSTDYAGAGMMAIHSLGGGEWWAGGDQNGGALLLHSTDNGMTWTKAATVPNVAIMELSFVSASEGYAIGVNAFQQSSFLRYM